MSDYIPTELLADILVRLPVQSLIRFTSVCKAWYSLVTSPDFIAKHLNHSKTSTENIVLKAYSLIDNKEHCLLSRGNEKFGDEFSKLECPFSSPVEWNRIVGSCNGLLCMFNFNGSEIPCIILWNPSIRKSITLPMPSLPQTTPLRCLSGFGAHPTTDEYILVFIGYEKEDLEQRKFPSKVELYTQGTGSWRSITSVGHPPIIAHCRRFPAVVNGAIHWISYERRAVDGLIDSFLVLFNMGSQAFSVMKMPAALAGEFPVRLSIVSYGDSLTVLCQGNEGSCSIWVMKEYGVAESWAKLYNFNLPGVLKNIIGFTKNGEVLLSTSDNQLLRYDCKTKTFTRTRYLEGLDLFGAYTFMESLVLLERENGVF